MSENGGKSGVMILLDVDGVLGARIGRPAGGQPTVALPTSMPALVKRLAALGEVVWATSWDFEVRNSLSEALGLPVATRGLTIGPTTEPGDAKRTAVDRFLRLNAPEDQWKAVVWVDDRIRAADRDWASVCGYPIELAAVDPERLLNESVVEEVEAAILARRSV